MATPSSIPATKISRREFPEGFIFGASSSAYQIEGGAKEDGRGPSIWDTFTNVYPDKVEGGANGNVAADSYHLYMEDVLHLKSMGLDAYRFSISWSRILPGGKLSAGINKAGINYYNNLINALLANEIQPFATIFHWDLPQALEDEYGGFLSPRIVDDFRNFAELCFREFGDRVKNWITINEPWSFSVYGYARGVFPPCRGAISQEQFDSQCMLYRRFCKITESLSIGNPGTEPYIVTHTLLLAHAAAVELYRSKFQKGQNGKIGITFNVHWLEPLDENNSSDYEAARVGIDFMLGWFMEPLTTGDYPESMKKRVGSRLPTFSDDESKKLIGSHDFIGINYYTSSYATFTTDPPPENPTYDTDAGVLYPVERDGVPIGPMSTGSSWLYIYPEGIRKILIYIKRNYSDPHVYITENGLDESNTDASGTTPSPDVEDMRINYMRDHLWNIRQAIMDPKYPVRVKGYFLWSLLDSFEWADGYTVSFGVTRVDFDYNRARNLKISAIWFKNAFSR